MYIVVLSTGMLTGLLLLRLTKAAIVKRTGNVPTCALINATYAPGIWVLVNAAVWLLVYMGYGISLYAFELVFACSACMVISIVDYCIRRIPNEALLALALVAVVGIFAQRTWGNTWDHLLGFLLGSSVFLIPFLIKKQAGAGDIKFAAVMGLYLGLYNTIIALLIMSVLFLVYMMASFVARKGNFNNTIALGPYISAGFVVTIALL